MKIIHQLTDRIFGLTKKEITIITSIGTGIVITACAIILFIYISQKNSLLLELKKTYALRNNANKLIQRQKEITEQKDIVDAILNKNPNFKLAQFFDSLAEGLRLNQYIENKTPAVETRLENQDYSEVTLERRINNINTKQAAELIEKIEENERVYIKKLEIIKSNKIPAVDVELTIATLQPKSE